MTSMRPNARRIDTTADYRYTIRRGAVARGDRQSARTSVVAIEIREIFQVQAPIEAVWQFVMDPQRVVTCMPGAALDEVVDAQTFLGTVKVKVGAITATYKGRVHFTEVDAAGHRIQMVAEGRETGGGMAKGTVSSVLRSLPSGQTEVEAHASVDLTGRLMQVGRGMIQGVASQLFQQFTASVKQRLEVVPAAAALASTGSPAAVPAAPREPEAIRVVPLLWRTLMAALARLWRRLTGAPAAPH